MSGPGSDGLTAARRLTPSLLGLGFLVAGVSYVATASGEFSTLVLEAALPLGVGVGFLVYGAWLFESNRPVEHVEAVASLTLVAIGVFALGGSWTLYLSSMRVEFGPVVGQQLLASMSAGGIVGGVIGHLYAERTRQLRENEQLSRAVNASMDGMAIVSGGVHVYANDAYAALYGFADRVSVEGRAWRPLYTEEARTRIGEEIEPVLENRDFWRGTLTGQRPDGTTFPKEATITVLEEGHVIVVRDVTERHDREQRIQVLNRVLRHNLRNAFTVIKGHANLIAEADDDLADRHVDPIVDEAADLLETADKARGVERTLGRREGYERVQAGTLVRRVVRRASEDYPEATIVSRIEESSELAVPPEIGDALSELVDNAVEHANASDPRVEVSVCRVGYENGDRIEFAVVDDGPGLPELEQQALSAGRETPLEHGSGLGLWMVQWIVQSAGGDVRFSERPGGGTVITVSLPHGSETDAVTAREIAGGPAVTERE